MGSKRLKDKNKLLIGGMSLVEIASRCALKTGLFDKIIISSDDIGHKANENISPSILFEKRPVRLCLDDTSTIDVLHYISDLYALHSDDLICLLQPTSPLRIPSDIELSMGSNNVTVSKKSQANPWLRHSIYQLAQKHNIHISNIEELRNLYFNGAVYWCTKEKLHSRKILFDSDTKFSEMSDFRSIDIDYMHEFEEADRRFIALGLKDKIA